MPRERDHLGIPFLIFGENIASLEAADSWKRGSF
jgi:hypothetical protein